MLWTLFWLCTITLKHKSEYLYTPLTHGGIKVLLLLLLLTPVSEGGVQILTLVF